MTVNLNIVEKCVSCLNIKESYDLARCMEHEKTNPVLGYRTAGSLAERKTGDMLLEEMKKAGLTQVEKDKIRVDAWEFKKAVMRCHDREGTCREIQLGAYQTDFKTNGFQRFDLVYLGKGTADEYKDINVKGKLVLIEINQREEWWINYPVYQAHLKGAAALIAVQSRGYAQIDDTALNAQDIAGPSCAPAFSMSRADFLMIRQLMEEKNENGNRVPELSVEFDADTEVIKDQYTYNIVGKIPGTDSDSMILLSAHYDSYFEGFQDDNAAVAMIIGIARALLRGGYKPRHTIVVCALAAEEWGISDTKYDWSTGAYRQVFEARPEWQGHVIADLNFELPALAHGTRARIRCCYEYVHYIKEYLDGLPELTKAYPEMTSVTAPIETWSDDFSMAIAGIPSMVNDFTGGSFMETHYHSQFDNDDFYDEAVYRLHHELFALLILALDETAVVPLDFTPVLERILAGGSEIAAKVEETQEQIAAITKKLIQVTEETQEKAKQSYEETAAINTRYHALLAEGNMQEAEQLFAENREREKQLLVKFKQEQDHFVRIDWYGEVFFPHEILWKNIGLLQDTINALEQSDVENALEKIYQVDNNAYAFMFDEYVYRHFTDYVFNQPKERLKWGYGRLLEHEDLYHVVKCLLKKRKEADTDYREELHYLKECYKKQTRRLCETLKEISQTVKEMF